MPGPAISVIVCTYNRYDLVGQTLDSLSAQSLQNDQYEILVIDNSSDIDKQRQYWSDTPLPPNADLIINERPGLSLARNTGLARSRGKFAAFIDDDAVADTAWLSALLAAFEDRPDFGIITGKIDPIWPASGEPSWLPPRFKSALTILDYGPADAELSEAQSVFGANMAIRLGALGDLRFDPNLGRSGDQTLLSCEETELQKKLEATGWKAGYAARARVRHRVDQGRLNPQWFRARMAWQAVSDLSRGAHTSAGANDNLLSLMHWAEHFGFAAPLEAFLQADDSGDDFDKKLRFVYTLMRFLLDKEARFPPNANQ